MAHCHVTQSYCIVTPVMLHSSIVLLCTQQYKVVGLWYSSCYVTQYLLSTCERAHEFERVCAWSLRAIFALPKLDKTQLFSNY